MAHFEQYPLCYQPQHYGYLDAEIKEEQLAQSLMNYTYETMYGNPQPDFKYETFRSISQDSFRQTHSDQAPSLHSPASGPSLPSPSSSTVGSPSSAHVMPVSQPIYPHEYILGPAIVDDSYAYAYESGHFDHDSAFRQTKFGVPCVGKFAKFSSVKSSTWDLTHQRANPDFCSSPLPFLEDDPCPSVPQSQRALESAFSSEKPTNSLSPDRSPRDHVFKLPTTPASAYAKSLPPSGVSRSVPTGALFLSQFSIFPSQLPTVPNRSYAQQSCSGQANDPVLVSGSRSPYVPVNYGAYPPPQQPQYSPAPSPAPSIQSYHSFSNPVTVQNFSAQHAAMRRQSSMSSVKSGGSPRSVYSLDDDSQKDKCPFPDCGRTFKDLKAHLLTHGSERPEKCPIVSCEYHKKGFARKYDKNRHTLTHYRGTMVCGFCPGSGSAAEKSFNRADVFKRHLTSVHNVEQAAPNSRKRSPSKAPKLSSYCPDATGKCSTCGATFTNAQEFYEHLDDCVLKVVQQEDPIEAVNARRMQEVLDDSDVQATFERNNVKMEENSVDLDEFDEDEYEDEDEDDEDATINERSGRGVIRTTKVTSNRPIIGGNVSKKTSRKGLTWSRGGGSIIGKSRKRRKDYPPSWGMAVDKMNMKKRVVCVYEGQRRLLKDDMMMYNEYEVRMPLLNGNNYVTDLDIETMKRSNAFHNATPEEKGPWIQDDYLNLSD